MHPTIELSNSPQDWIGPLNGLVQSNLRIIKTHPGIPPIYQSGVKYRAETGGKEQWSNLLTLLKQGFGDCEDLASWRVAELLAIGQKAKPWVIKTGVGRYHAVVKRADGTIEDPTKIVKRLERQRRAKQNKQKRLGMSPTSKRIKFKIQKIRGGYEARLQIPVFNGSISLSGIGPTRSDAVGLAAEYALNATRQPTGLGTPFTFPSIPGGFPGLPSGFPGFPSGFPGGIPKGTTMPFGDEWL